MHHQHHHQLKQRTTKRFSVFAHLLHFTAISIWAYLYLPVTLNDCPSLSPSPFMILYTYILYYIQFSRHIPPVSISVGDGVWASFYYYHYDYYYYKYPFPRLSLSVHHSSSAMSLIRYSSMHVVLPPTHSFPSIHPFSGDVQTKQSPYFYLPPTRVIIYINLIVVAVVVVVALLHSFNSSFITKSIYNTRWGALSVLVLGYSALFSSAYSLFVSDYSSEIYLHLGGYRSLVRLFAGSYL